MDATKTHQSTLKLRREVTTWGSFCWGYADVGADVYVALGLVIAAAQGQPPWLLPLRARSMSLSDWLILNWRRPTRSPAEASTLPCAHGGFLGTAGGSRLDAGLYGGHRPLRHGFAGYVNFFIPAARHFAVDLGPFSRVNLIWLGESMCFIAFLVLLNIKGIRESSMFNEVLGALDMAVETSIILLGFAFAWSPDMFLHQWQPSFPRRERSCMPRASP